MSNDPDNPRHAQAVHALAAHQQAITNTRNRITDLAQQLAEERDRFAELDASTLPLVVQARAAGVTWQTIADETGLKYAQHAYRKFGHRITETVTKTVKVNEQPSSD